MSAHGDSKAVLAALAANLGIAVIKLAAWALTGATSLLAEGVHSIADSGNQALLLLGAKRSRREATPEHPFGFGRERYVYAFVVSIVLFSVGGLFALYEAWHKLSEVRAGHKDQLLESRWWWIPIVVLAVAIVMEGLSFRTAVRESNRSRGHRSWVAFVRGAKSPELPVVLLEDFAALLGLVFALLGVGLTLITRNAVFDVIGAAAIGVLLVSVAVVLAIEMKSLLIGESASRQSIDAIRAALSGTDGVEDIIHLKTLHLGPDELLVTAKIAVVHDDSAAAVAAAIDAAERAIRAAEPAAQEIFLEPDLHRHDYAPSRRPGTAASAGD
ncbi:MAG: cation diffusion facilitator family transporter [Nocardioidaceae bacterium]